MQAPQTPSPLTLPPSVECPGAPVKKGKNNVLVGFSSSLNLGPIFKRDIDDRFTTPPRQRTVPRNTAPQRKKK